MEKDKGYPVMTEEAESAFFKRPNWFKRKWDSLVELYYALYAFYFIERYKLDGNDEIKTVVNNQFFSSNNVNLEPVWSDKPKQAFNLFWGLVWLQHFRKVNPQFHYSLVPISDYMFIEDIIGKKR